MTHGPVKAQTSATMPGLSTTQTWTRSSSYNRFSGGYSNLHDANGPWLLCTQLGSDLKIDKRPASVLKAPNIALELLVRPAGRLELRQRRERILCRNFKGREMAQIARKHNQAVRGGGGGNRKVRKPRRKALAPREIGEFARDACGGNVEWQDAAIVEMQQRLQPLVQCVRAPGCAHALELGDSVLDLGNGDGGEI